jgi:hypothetical protein
MKQFYTYLYRDIDGTPIYIGKGTKKRAWVHFKDKSNSRLGNLLRKRLKDGVLIEPEFLCKDVDEEFAFFVEEEMIRKYGRIDLGTGTLFNLTDGGDGVSGLVMSTESKAKFSARIFTNEWKENISKGHLGKKLSIEHINKRTQTIKNTIYPKVECPHCPKEGKRCLMTRYHFDNCKFKKELNVNN